MLLSIPILVEERSSQPGPPVFSVRPLFRPEPVRRAERLSRALIKLTNDLHRLLHDLGREPRHDALAEWAFHPPFEEATLPLRLELASGSQLRPFFLVGYAALGRKIYFTPALLDLPFEVFPGQSLADRATAVFTRHFREMEKEEGPADLDAYALQGRARLTTIEVPLHPAALAKKAPRPTRALLFGGEEKKDGEIELRRTGRPLHAQYPDDLERAVGRDREVEELARLLAAPERRPILLLGSRSVGKTAIVHELVWQMRARKQERFGGHREVWLVSPMRWISGMSFLGEWENRVLAIFDHAGARDKVLYFDDLPGLFTAGVSAARVVGQDPALAAFTDVLVALKARLNDPRRPLGTLLLLGPTGVGKTQSAKALAEYLFGSSERLLRFDLNEYVDRASVARLCGTAREPEGLLTGAIRRQPFSVVLFDEIEKAAPEAFDVLLTVLDEGRLSDALGRVADFTHAVLLLTSNLGTREARARLGFAAAQADREAEDAVYVSAAEKLFRPEFFNRLDRIIPFRALAPAHLEQIAQQLIQGVFARDGLRRRECLLHVSPAAMSRLVQLGHHPQLGARALKRVIEREVAQPMAEKLAALPSGTPMLVEFTAAGESFALRLQELQPVARAASWTEAVTSPGSRPATRIDSWLYAVDSVLSRVDNALAAVAPSGRSSSTVWTPSSRSSL